MSLTQPTSNRGSSAVFLRLADQYIRVVSDYSTGAAFALRQLQTEYGPALAVSTALAMLYLVNPRIMDDAPAVLKERDRMVENRPQAIASVSRALKVFITDMRARPAEARV